MSYFVLRPIPGLLAVVSAALLTISGALDVAAQAGTAVSTPTRTPTVRAAAAAPTTTPTGTAKPISGSRLPNQPAAAPPGSGQSYIGGTVYVDDNLDGSFNGEERGRKDVTVRLTFDSTTSGTSSVTVKTNDDGYYEFKSLATGTYLVSIEPPDGFSATTSKQREFTVNGTSTDGTRALNFGIFKTVSAT